MSSIWIGAAGRENLQLFFYQQPLCTNNRNKPGRWWEEPVNFLAPLSSAESAGSYRQSCNAQAALLHLPAWQESCHLPMGAGKTLCSLLSTAASWDHPHFSVWSASSVSSLHLDYSSMKCKSSEDCVKNRWMINAVIVDCRNPVIHWVWDLTLGKYFLPGVWKRFLRE